MDVEGWRNGKSISSYELPSGFFVLKFPERFQRNKVGLGRVELRFWECRGCGLEGWEDWSFGQFGSADQILKKENSAVNTPAKYSAQAKQ